MTGITPYLLFPGNAGEALEFYRSVFGGALEMRTFADFGRVDGPDDAVAHGTLVGPVAIYGADAGADEDAVHIGGMFFSLLGAAAPSTLHRWFEALADSGRILLPLERRAWGASDGQLVDQYGVRWLIGYEGA
ncbi:VOC family protein [Leucobacter alluvii]|uniref:VOC family protein n=1 Tax=Leucobacter alluvii TaxID=340321 RepID=A0ABN3B4W6_9MICO